MPYMSPVVICNLTDFSTLSVGVSAFLMNFNFYAFYVASFTTFTAFFSVSFGVSNCAMNSTFMLSV